ncbi:MAG: hypothetical protein ACOX29_03955 [Bacillota bacterium]|jgi:rod shape-determining protein MreD|nr:hypothetical protein [Bacillota bacterium]HOA91065.1 hypothetical protein [Bacillota bacterium]HPZ72819.1 hypothetical protein [Bacillota bacterium]HQD77667.1 hypothetical protein [Bacillota bacterium]
MRRWPYLIAAVVLSILEISFFPFLKGIVPAFSLLLAVLLALKADLRLGTACGILAGFVIDFTFGFGVPQMAITYGLIAYLIGRLAGHIVDLGLLTYLVAALVATVSASLMAAFFSLAFGYSGWQLVINWKNIGGTLLFNALAAVLVYLFARKRLPSRN